MEMMHRRACGGRFLLGWTRTLLQDCMDSGAALPFFSRLVFLALRFLVSMAGRFGHGVLPVPVGAYWVASLINEALVASDRETAFGSMGLAIPWRKRLFTSWSQ